MTLKNRPIIVKSNGEREPFDPAKLLFSLNRAGADESTAQSVLERVEKDLKDGMTTSSIYKRAFTLLTKKEKRTAARYSLRRAIADLGPTGFPFEDFFAEIMRAQGYTAITRQVVMGECVAHEMDVVAFTDRKLIMAEAKFHHEATFKSDLKIVLYIKERFDDLSTQEFNYGGKKRKLDEGWLVTNTKFTSTAIQYAECKNITLIGWNYPKKGNLQDLIEDNNLHPITCLPGLTSFEKDALIKSGIILCNHVLEDPDALIRAKIAPDRIPKIMEDMRHVYGGTHDDK